MSEWIELVALDELIEGQGMSVKGPDGHVYALFLQGGQVKALDDECCHQGGPLGEGDLDGDGVVSCPWHGWQFKVETGECLDIPGECVRAYPTRVENGKVQVEKL